MGAGGSRVALMAVKNVPELQVPCLHVGGAVVDGELD